MLHPIIVLLLMVATRASQQTLEVNNTIIGSEVDVINTTDKSNSATNITWTTEHTLVNVTEAHHSDGSTVDVSLVTDQHTSDVSLNRVTGSAKVIMTVSSAIVEATKEPKTINSTPETSKPTPKTSTSPPETSTSLPETSTMAPETSTMAPENSKSTPKTSRSAPETSTTAPESSETTNAVNTISASYMTTEYTIPVSQKIMPETSKTLFSKGIEATSKPAESAQRESPTEKSSKSEKARCAFDHCSVTAFAYCLHNGSCITDKSTCTTQCKCQKSFTGNRCQTEISKAMATELHITKEAKDDSTACSVLNCKNGNCVNLTPVTSRCVCNDGWFGSSCATSGHILPDEIIKMILPNTFKNDFPSPKTRSNEGAKITERVDSDNGQRDYSKKESTEVHETPRPIIKIKNNVISRKPLNLRLVSFEADDKNEQAESKESNLATADGFPDPRYNVCAEDRLVRTEDERTCDMRRSMPCKYGVCVQEEVDHGSWKGYVTNCTCDLGARGTFCDYKCCLDCGENGKCDIIVEGNNVTEHCNCRHRYTGLNCEIHVPDPVSIKFKDSKWFLWIVGACVALFVLLIVAAIIAPYMMWKHRVILLMKIVHYFQAYEDDDEKEWDAFVSYKSHPFDEHFVVHVLYPKLEKELGFKLCLHFRDFVPGETISNNIINAVEGSRRTILILTPRYIESEFTRFEYQKAQTEMLKRKHRIIPILLEDISGITSNMDKNLKGIINSVTYLEWPGTDEVSKRQDKFWKRLQLSLPKKKVGQQNSNLQSQSSADSGICSENSTGNDIGVSSAKSKWSEHSFGSMVSNISSVSYGDGDVYDVIGSIDEFLSRSVKPFSDSDELAQLANKGRNTSLYDYVSDLDTLHRVQDSTNSQQEIRSGVEVTEHHNPNSRAGNYNPDTLSEHYVDMEHDRYIEFSLEDNPPSVSLTRKAFVVNKKESPGCITLQTEGYIEIDV